MNLSVAEEAGLLQSWDETQNFPLLTEFQVVLEAYEIVRIGAQILLP